MTRDLATLGLALGGLATLVTGIFLLMSVAGRPHPLLVIAFLGSGALTVVSAALIIVAGVRSPSRRDHPNGDQ